MNKVLFLGRLVANPEYKINDREKRICHFRLAVDNGKNYEALFINVTVFDNLADQCQKYLQKASQIFIEGRLDSRRHPETKIEYFSVVAQRVTFLRGTKGTEEVTIKAEGVETEEKGE